MPLAVYHSNTSCRSLSNIISTESIFESHEYIVVSSASYIFPTPGLYKINRL